MSYLHPKHRFIDVKEALRVFRHHCPHLEGLFTGQDVVCAGNGQSRRGIDLDRVQRSGAKLIGCNSIIDEQLPDLACFVDGKVFQDAARRGFADRTRFFTANTQVKDAGKIAFQLDEKRHFRTLARTVKLVGDFAGGLAISATILSRPLRAFLIGHDLEAGNRIYQGQRFYTGSGPNERWVRGWHKVIQDAIDLSSKRIEWFEVDNNKLSCPTIDREELWRLLEEGKSE